MQQHEAVLPLQLKELNLSSFNMNWQQCNEIATENNWSYSKYLSYMCNLELEKRSSNRLIRRIKESSLPANKTLSGFDFNAIPELNPAQINALANCDGWVKKAHNIIIFGPSGVGKTHVASAIGYRQIELGNKVKFFKTSHLAQLLQQSKAQFRLKDLLVKLDRIPLIILDDIGYVKKDEHESSVLFELICQRYETGSLIITANQPFSEWDSIFPDNMMAVAAIDRIVHHASIINISAQSYRTKGR
ncbi:MAG: ATP-binding protein [Rhodobacteraceae bacterium]|jgi:DNA replication protein DnaC|nr:ATP-binding protein [Paracoccaceae bacterium]